MNEKIQFTFKKNERITGKKRVEILFENGQSFIAYPLRVIFRTLPDKSESQVSVLISVPKKKVKLSVNRNKIKRLIREAYRLNKHKLNQIKENVGIDIAFVFLNTEVVEFAKIEKGMCKAINEISARLISE